MRDASVGMEMLLPVCVGQVSIPDGTSAVEHHIVADIDTAMCDAFHIIAHGAFKEYDVARL